MKVSRVREALRRRKPGTVLDWERGLSTGCTLLNCAFSGRPNVGYLPGFLYFHVGGSNSGKTFLAHVAFAEACINPHFDSYRLIYDNAENGALMDIERFFGKRVKDRLEPPRVDKRGLAVYSRTVDDFYFHAHDAFAYRDKAKKPRPFIYILDSMDSLSSREELENFDKRKTAARTGKDAPGSYGMERAKRNSSDLRIINGLLEREKQSIIIIISQTRDRVGFGMNPDTRGGGRALTFYSTVETWFKVRGKITKRARGQDYKVGIMTEAKVVRTRITGQEHAVEFPIYNTAGVDDLGSCVDWLVDVGHWESKTEKEGKSKTAIIEAGEFDFRGDREAVVKKIEEDELEMELRALVGKVWKEIDGELRMDRKNRYLQ